MVLLANSESVQVRCIHISSRPWETEEPKGPYSRLIMALIVTTRRITVLTTTERMKGDLLQVYAGIKVPAILPWGYATVSMGFMDLIARCDIAQIVLVVSYVTMQERVTLILENASAPMMCTHPIFNVLPHMARIALSADAHRSMAMTVIGKENAMPPQGCASVTQVGMDQIALGELVLALNA